jgi:hypothetical protein
MRAHHRSLLIVPCVASVAWVVAGCGTGASHQREAIIAPGSMLVPARFESTLTAFRTRGDPAARVVAVNVYPDRIDIDRRVSGQLVDDRYTRRGTFTALPARVPNATRVFALSLVRPTVLADLIRRIAREPDATGFTLVTASFTGQLGPSPAWQIVGIANRHYLLFSATPNGQRLNMFCRVRVPHPASRGFWCGESGAP